MSKKAIDFVGKRVVSRRCIPLQSQVLAGAFFAGFYVSSRPKVSLQRIAKNQFANIGLLMGRHKHVTNHSLISFVLSGRHCLLVRTVF